MGLPLVELLLVELPEEPTTEAPTTEELPTADKALVVKSAELEVETEEQPLPSSVVSFPFVLSTFRY